MPLEDRRQLPKLPSRRMLIVRLVTLAVLVLGVFLSWQAGQLSRQQSMAEQQSQVQADLSDFRARLETRIYSSVAQLRGLAADLVIRESMTHEQFERIAEELRMSDPYMLNLSLAPGYKINEVYPQRSDVDWQNLDLMASTRFRPSLLNSIQLDDPVLSGPWPVSDGRRGLTCILPVWVAKDGVPRLWGATVLTLDFDALLEDAGLAALENDLRVDIRGRDALGPAGASIYGEEAPVSFHAVRVPAFVPGGSWLLSATPRDGWQIPEWWRTQAGVIGLIVTAFVTLAVFRILRDRLRIRTMAGVDPLTQLPNRAAALHRLNQLIARSQRNHRVFALLCIDLDGFKPINDTLGHAAGDEVLETIGFRLKQAVRSSDTIARMGGDEFLLLVDDEATISDERLLAYAQRIREALANPIRIQGQELQIGASIGVAAYPKHGVQAAELMREADAAMYRAKRDKGVGVELANGALAMPGAEPPA
ncbi:MAG TPA: diguanylate cyclase [Arenimonas sp.]|nr:diguanylate cyclase [Arenimonas sp.]